MTRWQSRGNAPSLRDVLSDIYLEPDSIRRVLEDATIDVKKVPLTGPAVNIWTAALTQARAQRKMRLLLNAVQSDYPDYLPLREAIENLIHARPDGYIVYSDPGGQGPNGYRDAINRIDKTVERLDGDMDRLRDAMLRGDEANRIEQQTTRHRWNEIWQPFILEYQVLKLGVATLTERLAESEKRIDALAGVGRRMLWFGVVFGVATGLSAVAGQGVLMLVSRALGWG